RAPARGTDSAATARAGAETAAADPGEAGSGAAAKAAPAETQAGSDAAIRHAAEEPRQERSDPQDAGPAASRQAEPPGLVAADRAARLAADHQRTRSGQATDLSVLECAIGRARGAGPDARIPL